MHLRLMADPNTWWYFYNSAALKLISTFALLGSVGYVIPSVYSLPQPFTFTMGSPNAMRAKYNRLRKRLRWIVWLLLPFSIAPILPYYLLLQRSNGKTTDLAKGTVLYSSTLLWLYGLTFILSIGLLFFYHCLLRVRDLHERASDV